MPADHETAKGKPALEKFQLTDKVAVVTGASRGLGRAIGKGLAEAGCDLVLASRTLPDLESLAREIAGLDRKALPVSVDLAHVEGIKHLVNTAVAEFGRVDILVNNAAANPVFGSAFDMDEESWDETTAVDLKAYFFLSQAVGHLMKEQGGGTIINIASTSGLIPDVGLGVYAICKAGVLTMTKTLGQEWGRYNIRVNAIAPGTLKTSFSRDVWQDPVLHEKTRKAIALGRIAEPEEIVGAVIFLASEASSYMTGETIVMEGGRFPYSPATMVGKSIGGA